MLSVLRHYLPIRTALLVFSETLLMALVLAAGMTLHLLEPTQAIRKMVMLENLSVDMAFNRCVISALLLAVVSQMALGFNELYDFRISSSRYERASRFVESAGTALGLSLLAVILTHAWDLQTVLGFPGLTLAQSVQTLVFTQLFGFGILYLYRNLFHYSLRRVSLNERALILGDGNAAHELAKEMLERPDSGYDVVGLLPSGDLHSPEEPPRKRLAIVGSEVANDRGVPDVLAMRTVDTSATQHLVLERDEENDPPASETIFTFAKANNVDLIVVALADRRSHLPTEELLRCRLAGISVQEQEALYENITGKISVTALRPSYLIFNEGFSRHPWAELLKRCVDVVLALIILMITWPLMILTAIAVRLDSEGPILFSQERVGENGESFTLLKFRSMRADAEKHTGPVWASEDDPRITRVGRFIRKTRLDELPQLFNILSGAMSLVGPRPERPNFVDDLAEQVPYFRQRHIVKPGLTGWAQINYPYGNTVEDAVQKLQYDLFYIKNQSLLFDLSILFNTIKTVVLRQGT